MTRYRGWATSKNGLRISLFCLLISSPILAVLLPGQTSQPIDSQSPTRATNAKSASVAHQEDAANQTTQPESSSTPSNHFGLSGNTSTSRESAIASKVTGAPVTGPLLQISPTTQPTYVSPVSCPVVASAVCLALTSPTKPLFNGYFQQGSVNLTTHYVFRPDRGLWFFYNPDNSNFTGSMVTAKWGSLGSAIPLRASGGGFNSSTVWMNYVQPATAGTNTGSVTLYFRELPVTTTLMSPNLKVVISYQFSQSGSTISLLDLNTNQKTVSCTASRILFGSTGYDISDSLTLNPQVDCVTGSVTYSNLSAKGTIDPTTIATSTTSFPAFPPYEWHIFYANNRYWYFYSDGTNEVCRDSTDGTTWSSATTIVSGYNSGHISFWVDSSNNIYYARTYAASSTYHRDGSLGSSGCSGISWNYAEASFTNAKTSSSSYAYIEATSTTNQWISIGTADASNHYVEVWACQTSSCSSSSHWTNVKLITNPTNYWWASKIHVVDSSNAILLYGVDSYSGTGGAIYETATTNAGSTWTSAITSPTTSYDLNLDGSVLVGSTVYFAGASSSSTTKFFTVTTSTSSISESSITTSSGGAGQYMAQIAGSGSSLFVTQVIDSGTIHGWYSGDGGSTWSSSLTVASGRTLTVVSSYEILGMMPSISGGTAAVGWVEGSSSPYNVIFTSFAVTVTQPVTCTMDNSASTVTASLSGGYPSPATIACDGSSHNITVGSSATLTSTEPSDGSTDRQRFSGSSTTTNVATCSSGTCSAWSFANYDEKKNTLGFSLSAGTTTSGLTWSFTGYVDSSSSATVCTISPSSGVTSGSNTSCWSNYSRAITAPAEPSGEASNERFRNSGDGTSTAGTPTTGGNTYTVTYYRQEGETVQYTLSGGGSPTAPTFTYTTFGTSGTTYTMTASGVTKWLDYNTGWTVSPNPLTGSGSTERWQTSNSLSGTAAAGGTVNPAFYHQFSQSVRYSVTCDTGTTCNAPILTYYQYGSTSSPALSTTATTYWIDSGTIASASTSITDNLNDVYTPYLSSWLINGANVIDNPINYWCGL